MIFGNNDSMFKFGDMDVFSGGESQIHLGDMITGGNGTSIRFGDIMHTSHGTVVQNGSYFSAPGGGWVRNGSTLCGPDGESYFGIESDDDVFSIISHKINHKNS